MRWSQRGFALAIESAPHRFAKFMGLRMIEHDELLFALTSEVVAWRRPSAGSARLLSPNGYSV